MRHERSWPTVARRPRPRSAARDPHSYSFTQVDGKPVRPDWLSHRFHALMRKLGLPPVRLHHLRHGAASLASAAGVELKVIQHDLGHSSAVTTADTYWTVFGTRHAATRRLKYLAAVCGMRLGIWRYTNAVGLTRARY